MSSFSEPFRDPHSDISDQNTNLHIDKTLINSSNFEEASGSKTHPSHLYSNSSKELSLLDLVVITFKAKYFIFVGGLLGLISAFAFFLFSTKTYHLKIPISLDTSSFPAITNPKEILDTYNLALASPEVLQTALESILKSSKEFSAAINAIGISEESIITQHILKDTKDPNKRFYVPIRLTQGTGYSEFFVETNFPAKGLNKDAPKILLVAINTAGNFYNKMLTSQKSLSARVYEKELKDSYQNLQMELQPLISRKINSELDIRSSLSEIEFQLEQEVAKTTSQKLNSTTNEVSIEMGNAYNQNPYTASFFLSEKQLLKIMRLKAILVAQHKLPPERLEYLNQKLFEIQKKTEILNSEFSPYFSSLRLLQEQLSEAQKAVFVPVDRKTMLLPSFKLSPFFSSIFPKNDDVEISSSSPSIYIFMGTILGIAFGLCSFVLLNCFKVYKQNIMEQLHL